MLQMNSEVTAQEALVSRPCQQAEDERDPLGREGGPCEENVIVLVRK